MLFPQYEKRTLFKCLTMASREFTEMGAATSSEEGQLAEGVETKKLAPSSSISDVFEDWCRQHGKVYSSDQERQYRLGVFENTYALIMKHNSAGNSSFSLGLNHFSDLTHDEFKAWCTGEELDSWSDSESNVVEESDVPASLDGRAKGAVTEVKDVIP
ncbi:PREDICTED: fruit bromelain-like [Ipomoea nil]|uniref:fruit bromelain-like n=1 Tax=Ipomoea nil TaxID=35883 RepID=UPI000901C864|nr:PREDICTED: fruit bromelain-like [Ipomoea nil]